MKLGKTYRPRRAHSRVFVKERERLAQLASESHERVKRARWYQPGDTLQTLTLAEARQLEGWTRFTIGSRAGCLNGCRIEGEELVKYLPMHPGGNGYGPSGTRRMVIALIA